MKTIYALRILDDRQITTVDDYYDQYNKVTPIICVGLQDLWNHCGGKLPRQRNGYSGIIGTHLMIAERL